MINRVHKQHSFRISVRRSVSFSGDKITTFATVGLIVVADIDGGTFLTENPLQHSFENLF